jgi:hypothetical protein
MPAREKAPVTAKRNVGLQDDHDPNDIGQQQNKTGNDRQNDRRRNRSSAGKLDEDQLPDDESKFG